MLVVRDDRQDSFLDVLTRSSASERGRNQPILLLPLLIGQPCCVSSSSAGGPVGVPVGDGIYASTSMSILLEVIPHRDSPGQSTLR